MMNAGLPTFDPITRDAKRGPAPVLESGAEYGDPAAVLTRALVGRTVAEVERHLILDTLDHCCGNRTQTAEVLGISIRTLRNKLGAYAAAGFAVPEPRTSPSLSDRKLKS